MSIEEADNVDGERIELDDVVAGLDDGGSDLEDWWLEGSYFEACNCESVCPCRQRGDREGGRSTYGICDFAASWIVEAGAADGVDLEGLEVVLAGRYLDDEPGIPFRISLYIDERADDDQFRALADIFLGRVECPNLGFLQKVIDVYAVRRARIDLDHAPGSQQVEAGEYVTIRAREPVAADYNISCAIPGHDRPGTEYVIDVLRVDEPPLCWEITGQTGFASDFAYRAGS